MERISSRRPPRGVGSSTPNALRRTEDRTVAGRLANALFSRPDLVARAAGELGVEYLMAPVDAFARLAGQADYGTFDPNDMLTASMGMIPGSARAKPRSPRANSLRVGYNPLPVAERGFADDYARSPRRHDDGRLAETIEGVELDAPFVVGRRRVGEADRSLAASEVDDIAGRLVRRVGSATKRDLGRYVGRYGGGPDSYILTLDSLDPSQKMRVLSHEVGHAIDNLAGTIDGAGLSRELGVVYSDLATGQQGRTRHLTRPRDVGYSRAEEPGELMAEAIRAYMTDPNYLKTVAPKTAARIRAAVNTDPRLRKTIQFNARGGGPAPVAAEDDPGWSITY